MTRLKPCPPKDDVQALSQREELILFFAGEGSALPQFLPGLLGGVKPTDSPLSYLFLHNSKFPLHFDSGESTMLAVEVKG